MSSINQILLLEMKDCIIKTGLTVTQAKKEQFDWLNIST